MSENDEIRPIGDDADNILARIERLKAHRAHLGEVWLPSIAALPETRCNWHPERILEIDLDLSVHLSAKNNKPTRHALPCPACKERDDRLAKTTLLLALGIPADSTEITLATWRADWEPTKAQQRQAALESVKAWISDRPCPFLIFSGRPGTGKTSLACAALRGFGKKYRCVHFGDWISKLLTLGVDGQGPEVEKIREIPILMVDEIGARGVARNADGAGNQFERDILGRLVGYRTERAMPTILTTNLSPQDFSLQFHERDRSRISGANKTGRVWIDAGQWPSYRNSGGI